MIPSSTVEVVLAKPTHVGPIATRMREQDRLEAACFQHSPRQALRSGMIGGEAWVVLVDGRPEAMFGVVVNNAMTGAATPWMLGTDEVFRHGRTMMSLGMAVVQHWVDSRLSLENVVAASNHRSIRMLRRWGFTVEDDEMVVAGVPFRRFWRRHV